MKSFDLNKIRAWEYRIHNADVQHSSEWHPFGLWQSVPGNGRASKIMDTYKDLGTENACVIILGNHHLGHA